ncbi:hypothetical protein POJ06DRAFT_132610 [Lipomyces tetrasporus]|uniref:Uncharacterized protein n=1 Tax=Lipomyces tetrasporus TaxID=54092 RepID=A0AAD7VSS1_9ASCO|nr:uncharacterized protein POJ06DRAFT_132610 [Lipomyces tetrasporus]KAJ8099310.1 hypothetical protein POJ06DRAFT_132610 [Lipomyces tetrasporus]
MGCSVSFPLNWAYSLDQRNLRMKPGWSLLRKCSGYYFIGMLTRCVSVEVSGCLMVVKPSEPANRSNSVCPAVSSATVFVSKTHRPRTLLLIILITIARGGNGVGRPPRAEDPLPLRIRSIRVSGMQLPHPRSPVLSTSVVKLGARLRDRVNYRRVRPLKHRALMAKSSTVVYSLLLHLLLLWLPLFLWTEGETDIATGLSPPQLAHC